GISFFLRRAHRDRVFSRSLRRPRKIPCPKRIRSRILTQLRRFPCLQIVVGNFDFCHPPISAERSPAQIHAHPRRNFSASIRRNQKRSHRHPPNRQCLHSSSLHRLGSRRATRRVRNPVRRLHPDISIRSLQYANRR